MLQQKNNYGNIIIHFSYFTFCVCASIFFCLPVLYLFFKMRKFLTLATKKIILEEAYCRRGNIKPTARKYNVDPANIRRWKKSFRTTEMPTGNKMSNFTLHQGPKPSSEGWTELREFYDNLREQGRLCTVKHLAYEYARITNSNASMETIFFRVNRWRKRENLVYRRVTHVAQNTRYNQTVIDDFVLYTNEQISSGKYSASEIVNMDETNVYFNCFIQFSIVPH